MSNSCVLHINQVVIKERRGFSINRSILKVKEMAVQILKICDFLLLESSKSFPDKYFREVKKMERLIIDQYCTSKDVLPPSFVKQFGLKRTPGMSQYIEIFHVRDDELYFRVPILPHKTSKEDLIIDIMHYVFQSILSDRGSIPAFLYHTIDFVHVYPTALGRSKSIVDHDNYNVRGVINIIVLYIQSSDSGLNSWHSHKTILSDQMQMGTYITIKKRTENMV